jgi:hypothetical protein
MNTAKPPAAIMTPLQANHHCEMLDRSTTINQQFNLSQAKGDGD